MVSWPNFLVSRGLCQTCSVVCVDARMCTLVRANTAVVLETPSEPTLMGYIFRALGKGKHKLLTTKGTEQTIRSSFEGQAKKG